VANPLTVAIVTGAGSGIGKAVATAERHAKVVHNLGERGSW
jgi:NADP-dependent 3-hydroxy acid dehydrogenase YdfG